MKTPGISKLLLLACIPFLWSCNPQPAGKGGRKVSYEDVMGQVLEKMVRVADFYMDSTRNPRSEEQDGTVRMVRPRDWTSGFYPGILWQLYEYSGEETLLKAARKHTELLESIKTYTGTHDLGFMLYNSYGQGLRLTGDQAYKEVLIEGARSLASRYNETVGAIRSWDHHADIWKFPVIIDNMMNLEYMYWAAEVTGEERYYDIAVNHSLTSMEHHYRDDYSSYHVVDFDPETGEVRSKETHQGMADESAWARGQAWGLYGFTMTFRESGEERFLTHAENVANFLMNHPNLPEDMVPYYDYDAPGPDDPRDASAAALIADACLELYTVTGREKYLEHADGILQSLCGPEYFMPEIKTSTFLIDHSTGSKPGNSEIDVPIIYGDYYFVEALIRRLNIE